MIREYRVAVAHFPSRACTMTWWSRATDILICDISAFISAECFNAPPNSNVHPRIWDRIAVPTATERRSHQKIYKRFSAKPRVDRRYHLVVAELESQGLEERKRARVEEYVVPYGSAKFEDEIRPEVTGEQELAEARGMSCVKSTTCMHVIRSQLVDHTNDLLRPSRERFAGHMEG